MPRWRSASSAVMPPMPPPATRILFFLLGTVRFPPIGRFADEPSLSGSVAVFRLHCKIGATIPVRRVGDGFLCHNSRVAFATSRRAMRAMTGYDREKHMEQRFAFDQVASVYRAVRPDYPDALVDDVVSYAALKPNDRILEVGCGTGQATKGFAKRGFPILATDPGAEMLRGAREGLAG